MLKPGTPAPLFEARLSTGELFRLENVRDKCNLVLYFYPKDFTYNCTSEACSFRDHFQEMKVVGSIILGVSPDSTESHQQFAHKHHLPFPLISDPNHELSKLYEASLLNGLRMLRITYVIDRSGVVRGAFHHEILVERHWDNAFRILKSLEKVIA